MINKPLITISNIDAEFIVRLQKRQDNAPRIRRWLIAFLIPLTVLYIAVLIYAVQSIQQWGNGFAGGPGLAGIGPGFMIGIVLGMKIGLLMLGLLHFWAVAILTKTRERDLLLRFHDYLAAHQLVNAEN